MTTIRDEDLAAFADGALSPEEAAPIEAALAADPDLARKLERHQALRARLASAYAPVLSEPVPDRLSALLAQPAAPAPAAPVIDLASRRKRAWGPPQWAAMAASVVLGVMAGRFLAPGGEYAAGPRGLIAQGALARALDDNGGAKVAIGLSFKAQDGRFCRTYTMAAQSGLACRETDGWAVETLAESPPQRGEYRMAASPAAPEVLSAVDRMIAGEPLDAAGVEAARAAGWR